MNYRVAIYCILLFIILLWVTTLLMGFGPLDGVWQLSSFWTLESGTFFFNRYTQNHSEHFYLITYLLSPVLWSLGSKPINLFFTILYLLNVVFAFLIIRPRSVYAFWVLIVIITSVFFNQSRIEDLSVLLYFIGFYLLRIKSEWRVFIYGFWLVLMPLIHPVVGLLSIVFFIYLVWKETSVQVILIPAVLGAIVWLYIIWSNHVIYFEQMTYRYSADKFQLIIKSLPYLLPLALLPLTRIFKIKEIALLILIFLVSVFMGKPYYLSSLFVFTVYLYNRAENVDGIGPKRVAAIVVIAAYTLILFPINKIFQYVENPSAVMAETEVLGQLKKYTFDQGGVLFVEPEVSQLFLTKENARFYIFEPHQKRIITNQPIYPGDQMIVTDIEALEKVITGIDPDQIRIDTLVSNNTGFLKLSSLYQRRKNGANLWVVRF